MIYTKLTRKAMEIACKAHHKQKDKGGFPYINHPFHIAEDMPDEITTCVALLHDVVEDSNITLSELSKDFPPEVINAVELLTHKEKDLYSEYIQKIKTNETARIVKLADLKHNLDQSRYLDHSLNSELMEKYLMAYTVLKSSSQDRM